MKAKPFKKIIITSCLAGFIASAGSAFAGENKKSDTHFVTQDISWQKSPFGPEVRPVDGDFGKGQHITYIKFNAGDVTPLHIHSADYVGIVVTGTTRHYIPGKKHTYKILPPGSYWSIPANVKHVSECLPGVECVMAIYQKAAFDFIPRGDAPKID